MNINYSNEIYRIVSIKKNSVSVSLIDDDSKIYHNIKKKYIQIIKESNNNVPIEEKIEVEKKYKVKSKLKKEDLIPNYDEGRANIRLIKKPERYL